MTIMNQVEIKAKMMALQDAIASALKNKTFEKELTKTLKWCIILPVASA